MLRTLRNKHFKGIYFPIFNQEKTFLTNDYKCTELWNVSQTSPVIPKINLNDFYIQLDQNYASKGIISAIDVDLFVNAIKDPYHLEELKDLLHKLRLSAETGNMLDSTSHATVRNFIEHGYFDELIGILKEPLHYGVFLDDFSANILLNELLKEEKIELAADVAALVMLQEDFTNELTCTLCQYACYRYILSYIPPETITEEKPKKVEEIKIRVKFLRNPYFDDHFDIKDRYILCGKTLALISQQKRDNLNINMEIVGWLVYKKYDKLLSCCKEISTLKSFKIYNEVIDLLKKENTSEQEGNQIDQCISLLGTIEKVVASSLEKALSNAVENAINKTQAKDIQAQNKLYHSWAKIREEKLEEQLKRLDRARRIQLMEHKQKEMLDHEQKLWFFENEEQIDLEIEEKEKLVEKSTAKKASQKTDENYIPPEILPKRR